MSFPGVVREFHTIGAMSLCLPINYRRESSASIGISEETVGPFESNAPTTAQPMINLFSRLASGPLDGSNSLS